VLVSVAIPHFYNGAIEKVKNFFRFVVFGNAVKFRKKKVDMVVYQFGICSSDNQNLNAGIINS
ncbi:MAG: hypothetical protein IIV40_04825, partial [Oscillospiraceae bacterium]|nr:hypothetical protein [Oscillospiraceae bacterium]